MKNRSLTVAALNWVAALMWVAAALIVLTFAMASAQASIELTRSATMPGGVHSSGGGFELDSAIGQSQAGLSASKSFTLASGLWLPLSPGDCDSDGTVSIIDYESLALCMAGPGVAPSDGSCRCFDLDASSRVDLRDFALYTSTFTGP